MTERERLIELIEQCSCQYSPPCTGECGECHNVEMYDRNIEHIADHLLANGVIVPPVKIGDTVYDFAVRECRVISVHFYDEGLPAFTVERTGYHGVKIYTTYTFNKIGESVFITREEAERSWRKGASHDHRPHTILDHRCSFHLLWH